jgi:hypothetical protein
MKGGSGLIWSTCAHYQFSGFTSSFSGVPLSFLYWPPHPLLFILDDAQSHGSFPPIRSFCYFCDQVYSLIHKSPHPLFSNISIASTINCKTDVWCVSLWVKMMLCCIVNYVSFWVILSRHDQAESPCCVGRMGSNCIILLGAQEGNNSISLVCGKVSLSLIFKTNHISLVCGKESLFLIFKTNVPWFQSIKF